MVKRCRAHLRGKQHNGFSVAVDFKSVFIASDAINTEFMAPGVNKCRIYGVGCYWRRDDNEMDDCFRHSRIGIVLRKDV